MFYGVYVCKSCADTHKEHFGNHQVYVKDVYGEQWDDYQLRSLVIGGNKKFFEILKEYQSEGLDLKTKYKTSCAIWYKQKHLA